MNTKQDKVSSALYWLTITAAVAFDVWLLVRFFWNNN